MTKPSGRRPRRRIIPRRPLNVVQVLTEGAVTEPGYLTLWARLNRYNVRLNISDRGKTPDALVRRAREYVRTGRPRHRVPDFDEIWCVFDVDQHPYLQQAVNNAAQSGIEVAVSNPCVELWLVLHLQEQTAFIHRRDAQRLSNDLGLTHGKDIHEGARRMLIDTFETAKRRARRLSERHEGNGSPPRTNPSTDMWRLVDRLRQGLDAMSEV